MTEVLPAVDKSARRRMDTFDPTKDGYKGYTLGAAVRAAERALKSLDTLEEALFGCMTPLRLRETAVQIRGMREDLAEELDVLRQAQTIIEADLPILHLVSENPDANPEGRTHDPRRLIEINEDALTRENCLLTTYREWSGPDSVPQLIRNVRAGRERAAQVAIEKAVREAEREKQLPEQLAQQAEVNRKRAAHRKARKEAKAATAFSVAAERAAET